MCTSAKIKESKWLYALAGLMHSVGKLLHLCFELFVHLCSTVWLVPCGHVNQFDSTIATLSPDISASPTNQKYRTIFLCFMSSVANPGGGRHCCPWPLLPAGLPLLLTMALALCQLAPKPPALPPGPALRRGSSLQSSSICEPDIPFLGILFLDLIEGKWDCIDHFFPPLTTSCGYSSLPSTASERHRNGTRKLCLPSGSSPIPKLLTRSKSTAPPAGMEHPPGNLQE